MTEPVNTKLKARPRRPIRLLGTKQQQRERKLARLQAEAQAQVPQAPAEERRRYWLRCTNPSTGETWWRAAGWTRLNAQLERNSAAKIWPHLTFEVTDKEGA